MNIPRLVTSGVKITVSHWLKTNQFSKFAAHCLVWSEIFQIMEEWLYTVVLTCVVGVTDINNINFSVAGRLKNQVRPQYCIVLYTVQNLKGM